MAEGVITRISGLREGEATALAALRVEAVALLGAGLVALGEPERAADLLRLFSMPYTAAAPRGITMGRVALAQAEYTLGRGAECEAVLEELAEVTDPQLTAEVALIRAQLTLERGQLAAAMALLRRAHGVFAEHREFYGICRAELALGRAFAELGLFEQALGHLEQARQAAERLGNRKALGRVRCAQAQAQERLGRWMESLRLHEDALRNFQEAGARRQVAMTLGAVGVLQCRLGLYGRAVSTFQHAAEQAEELHLGHVLLRAFIGLGRAHAALGAHATAARSLADALVAAREVGSSRSLARALQAIAEVQLVHGRPEPYQGLPDLKTAFIEAVEHARASSQEHLLLELLTPLVAELQRQGDTAAALDYQREYTQVMERMHLERVRRLEDLLANDHGVIADDTQLGILRAQVAELMEALDETRREREEVRELGRNRRGNLHTIAAGLKVPLAAIRAAAEALRDGGAPQRAQAAVAEILDAANRARRSVQSWLDDELLDEGRLQLELGTLDLMAVLQDLVAECNRAGASRRVQATVSGPAFLPVQAEACRLEQAVHGLLDYALEQAEAGSSLQVMVSLLGAEASVLLDCGAETPDGPAQPAGHTAEFALPVARRLLEAMGGSLRFDGSSHRRLLLRLRLAADLGETLARGERGSGLTPI